MINLIDNFPNQIEEALKIGENYSFILEKTSPKHIVICGLGGSGIGGSFVKDVVYTKLNIPVEIVKGYTLPNYVSSETLVIISSYSGNTEETVACLKKAITLNAKIVSVSSNGQIKKISQQENIDLIQIPEGMPPRSCLAYSSIQLFFILHHFNLIDAQFKTDFSKAKTLIEDEREDILNQAKELSAVLYDKIPTLYIENSMESLAIRWRQQINENGKQLCWHHVVPEMNHNELVGWRQKNDDLAVVFLRNQSDLNQNKKRIDLNKIEYKKYTPHVIDVWSKGDSMIEKFIYLNNLGDYMSVFLAEKRGFDATEVDVIDRLKVNLLK